MHSADWRGGQPLRHDAYACKDTGRWPVFLDSGLSTRIPWRLRNSLGVTQDLLRKSWVL